MEYGDAMQVYADVAGLRRRLIVVLPFLTPTIASWWVGLVTPIPSGLARPLVESLECDAVMRNHDIDAVIAPPEGGLTGYRDAVAQALQQDGTAARRTTPPGEVQFDCAAVGLRVGAAPRRCRCRPAAGCRCGRRWPASAR